MYKSILKPFLDLMISSIIFILMLPVFCLITILLFFFNRGKPFFVQERPGKNEIIFQIIKFRTMNNKKNDMGEILPDAERLTGLGRFVRSTSLDELPQLLNVMKGDMSLVGPRPLLPEYLPLYNDLQRQRHLVKPGITGYAQVNGRNDISWEKKFELDNYYVKKISFALDCSILIQTIMNVLIRKNINKINTATTERFKGTRES